MRLLRRRVHVLSAVSLALALALSGCNTKPGRTDADAAPAATGAPSEPAPSADPASATPGPTSAAPTGKPSSSGPKAAGAPMSTLVADRLRKVPTSTRQLVVVHSASMSATTATLETFRRSGTGWQRAFPAMSARIGGKGFSDSKREGDLTTPTGTYTFDGTIYGIAADPGVKHRYHRLVENDWWNENSASPGYNTFHHGADPGAPSEPLWKISPQYTYLAVIRYNMPATPHKGSGIFLHQFGSGATAGCVALSNADLVTVLRWLDPAEQPRIVMGPTSWLDRY